MHIFKEFKGTLCQCTQLVLLWGSLGLLAAHANELVIDTVLASVDDEPVTLMDLTKAVGKELTLQEYKADKATYKSILDGLINRKVIEREAELTNIEVDRDEVDQQLKEIALQNQMSMEDFKVALQQQNQTIENLKAEIRFQILRSKVVRRNVQHQTLISDEEVLKHLGISNDQDRVDISFVLIPFAENKPDAAQIKETALKIFRSLQDKVPFQDVLKAYSTAQMKSADNKIVARSDLSEVIIQAIDNLEDGETARPIMFANGIQILRLNKSLPAGEKIDSSIIERARLELQSKNMQQNALAFLTEELPKKHHIEILG